MTHSASPATVSVTVRLFARYAELLGSEALELELPEGSNVGDVLDRLRRQPGGQALPARVLVARNMIQASEAEPVAPGDEIALLPPMSGG